MTAPYACKLSICIATFNRARFIGDTLDSILSQESDELEVIVLDGASTDETQTVVEEYARRFRSLRYVRQETNNGVDRDYDRATELAIGEYCWFMSDDDLLKAGAVRTVLDALRDDLSLIVVNLERRNVDMSEVLLPRLFNIYEDRRYSPEEMDRLFVDTAHSLTIICCVVIKRAVWLQRQRVPYYGSMFIHVGVIFQDWLPTESLLIERPLIAFRDGNTRSFWGKLFEIQMIKWPELIWSLAPSESAKLQICSKEPWRSARLLLLYRAVGWYSRAEYRSWIRDRVQTVGQALLPRLIAWLPGVLVNMIFVLKFSLSHDRYRRVWLLFLRDSRFNVRNWKQRLGVG